MRQLCMLVFAAGCADPHYGAVIDSDPNAAVAIEHPLSADVQAIWDNNCGTCHVGDSEYQIPFLDDGYTATVNVESSIAGLSYIVPEDPDNSYLLAKLRGTQALLGGGGGNMPQGGTISDTDLETITNWITDGAPE